jgi:hypothetical protein
MCFFHSPDHTAAYIILPAFALVAIVSVVFIIRYYCCNTSNECCDRDTPDVTGGEPEVVVYSSEDRPDRGNHNTDGSVSIESARPLRPPPARSTWRTRFQRKPKAQIAQPTAAATAEPATLPPTETSTSTISFGSPTRVTCADPYADPATIPKIPFPSLELASSQDNPDSSGHVSAVALNKSEEPQDALMYETNEMAQLHDDEENYSNASSSLVYDQEFDDMARRRGTTPV